MYPTVEFLTRRYIDFNHQMFGGTLPQIQLKVTNGRQRLGCFKCKRYYDSAYSKVQRLEYIITISGIFDLPKEVIEDILIHEMIHFKLSLSGVDEESHGDTFMTMMTEINERFNRNVKVKVELPPEASQSVERLTRSYIFTFKYKGKEYFSRVAATCLFSINRELLANSAISDVKLYGTMEPMFERYRRARSLKGYYLTDEVQQNLDLKGVELVIAGGECRPK